jgi:hypothetical protein
MLSSTSHTLRLTASSASVMGFGCRRYEPINAHADSRRRPKAARERRRGGWSPGAAGAMEISGGWRVQREGSEEGQSVGDERA